MVLCPRRRHASGTWPDEVPGMQKRTLTERVQILEKRVGELVSLPARMTALESQFLQLRGEMRSGFSAIEAIDRRFEAIDQRFAAIDQRFDFVDRRFEAVDRRFENLERQVRDGDEETRRYMRVLHEEVLARLAVIQEGRGPSAS
jgi:hypothetical protein